MGVGGPEGVRWGPVRGFRTRLGRSFGLNAARNCPKAQDFDQPGRGDPMEGGRGEVPSPLDLDFRRKDRFSEERKVV